MSATALVGFVAAVAARRSTALAAPLGLAALGCYVVARASLPRTATTRRVDDRSYAIAYPIAGLATLVGLFVAFLAVHESGASIGESVIHAAYWAALGVAWLLPVAVQAWRRHPRRARVRFTAGQQQGCERRVRSAPAHELQTDRNSRGAR